MASWSAKRKQQIRDSRVKSTQLLTKALVQLKAKPKAFFSASAIGYYPSSGDEALTELHPPGQGFLPEVCQAWEAATEPAQQAGIRTVLGRISIVLSAQGGTLKALLPLFRSCLAGRLGSGQQYMPWMDIGDLVNAIYFCLMDDRMAGPVNLASPHAVTNREFTATLAKVVSRPAVLPVPAFMLRLALGEMADALLLASLRVVPERMQQAGFACDYPFLEAALRHQISR